MKNEQAGEKLREALATAERGGVGRPYPALLRAAALEYRRERARDGAGLRVVAAELGVSAVSLERWSRKSAGKEASFRVIEVVSDEVVSESVRRGHEVVVHGPRGLRIEGLTVAELAELVERLS